MTNDVEADFWKDIFVHMQHKNMIRIGAEKLTVDQSQVAFDRFALAHPNIQAEITNHSSYVTWEIFISQTIKLRLFIQNQIKGTLLQRSGGDLVKIADAKFPNNPFPEIEEFLSNRDALLRELHSKIEISIHETKKQQLIEQFIKANLIKKFRNKNDIIWTLEQDKTEFKLTLQNGKDIKTVLLTCNNYINEIASL